jgi:hypothetical protein
VPNVKGPVQRKRNIARRKRPISPFRPVTGMAPEPKPVRGMKLKTVSRLTLLFALACLGAFVAGRPPIAAGQLSPTTQAVSFGAAGGSARLRLRHDDARSFALRLRR